VPSRSAGHLPKGPAIFEQTTFHDEQKLQFDDLLSLKSKLGRSGGGEIPANLQEARLLLSLEIIQREAEGVCVLTLNGRLVLGQESNGFRKTIENILASGITRLVINLEHVNYIDSAGLGTLIEAHRTANATGGRLRLSNLGPNFKRALQIARLLDLFETFSTEADALEGF